MQLERLDHPGCCRAVRVILVIYLSIGFAIACFGSEEGHGERGSTRQSCDGIRIGFINDPGKAAAQSLQESTAPECWSTVASSNKALQSLLQSVAKGNLQAARYLAPHVHTLDGGNLEDALASLGEFSEHDMTELFALTQSGALSDHELTDAVTMLPLSLSDDSQAQLSRMQMRRAAAVRVSEPSLVGYRDITIRAIDESIAEIKRFMDFDKATDKTQ